MKISRIILNVFFCFIGSFATAQLKSIKGEIVAKGDVEGIHILNRTALKYTVTDVNGRFEILVKASDSLIISSLKYKQKTIVISKAEIDIGLIQIELEEQVNVLDDVILGRLFTGNLDSDIKNTETEDEINFYDLGIPGYTGKPLTLNERKLHDADAGPWGYIGFGFGVNFHKLLNRVSGRTKELREIVRLDANEKCVRQIRDNYERIIFQKEVLADSLKTDYFYFCSDDTKFDDICKTANGIATLEFLQEKLKAYKANLNSTNDD